MDENEQIRRAHYIDGKSIRRLAGERHHSRRTIRKACPMPGQLPEIPGSAFMLGELALDGSLRHTNGVPPMVVVARDEGFQTVFVPAADAREAALVEGMEVVPVASLSHERPSWKRQDPPSPDAALHPSH